MERSAWPKFDAGNANHLHAIGVIAVTYVQFERSVESMFLHHPANKLIPNDLLTRYFLTLNEEQRIKAIHQFYSEAEKDQQVVYAAHNVLKFFDWAHDTRNKVLHSERYPAGVGADADRFYATKRASKRDPSSKYITLDLDTLRSIADRMREGIVASAEINIHVRYRDESHTTESKWILPYLNSSGLKLLPIPERIKLADYPWG
ncbi:hypothetical protein [Afipia felis]|uniref:Uncharacterized protein n=2 Tax=Afipia felis TaxID=1035 RepID=A0A380W960_AFIFE|nr:hypothetical protein [Afipia felis]EKS28157.1 hypothetical protein HMPREF9697_00685 [Afipia felis ATCC 53690]SUU76867.1 Uncharacterised protein [Afipia felis]SUU84933.1 Uncharacterised protein [Afipia felis]